MSDEKEFAYERIPYPSFLHSQTNPERLAVMAKFYGMKPAHAEKCRVLELGCGNGSSLLAFAYGMPASEFVGVDLAENHIRRGAAAAREIGLKNLRFVCADVTKMSRAEFGEFDYIIAHGLYSWVPEFARDAVLGICREMLAAHGVAFISYNALPGCYLRLMTGGMMRFHTENIAAPEAKVNESLALLKFLRDAAADNKVYRNVLSYELEKNLERPPEVVFHDDLADFNQPFYFHEFCERAGKFGLKFLSEINYFTTKDANYSPAVREFLARCGDDRERREQYFDFVKNRRFRQTLLCRREVELRAQPDAKVLREIYIAADIRAETETPDFAAGKVIKFTGVKNAIIQIDHPLTKAALYILGKNFPRAMKFDELLEAAKNLLDFETKEADEENLGEVLMQIFGSGIVEFHTFQPQMTLEISERPAVSELARWQARNADQVSTLRCATISLEDNLVRNLLILFDGTRTRGDVLGELEKQIEFENEAERKSFTAELPPLLDANLEKMARLGFLIA